MAELSDKEAEDLLGIRLLIEPFGAERAATRRTAVHLATLELLVAEARRSWMPARRRGSPISTPASTGYSPRRRAVRRWRHWWHSSDTRSPGCIQSNSRGAHRTRGPSTRELSRRCATRTRRRRATGSPTTSCVRKPPTGYAESADRRVLRTAAMRLTPAVFLPVFPASRPPVRRSRPQPRP